MKYLSCSNKITTSFLNILMTLNLSLSIFNDIVEAPPIEPFQLTADFKSDAFPKKVFASAGAYRDDNGKPWILPVVKKAEKELAQEIADEKINHEYLPVLGDGVYAKAATKFLLGIKAY